MPQSAAFDSYYQAIYEDRWPVLRQALIEPRRHVARVTSLGAESGGYVGAPEIESGCLAVDQADLLPESEQGQLYLMDLASVYAARSLGVEPGMTVWDACAAPGGKTLILLEALAGSGSLDACDLSRARCAKMKQVITTHSTDFVQVPLRVVSCDSVNWGYRHQDTYDAVMLDVPCSSERHVITDATHLNQWTEKRVKTLLKRQYALLCSAVLACKPGGRIVYSTCSINPEENDGIIERYLEKKPGVVRVCELNLPIGRPTKYGWSITPDQDEGWGPLFFIRLERASSSGGK